MYWGLYSRKIASMRVAFDISATIVSASISRQRSCNSRRMSCNGVSAWSIRINLYGLKDATWRIISLPIEPRLPSKWEAILWISTSIGSRCKRSSICISFSWVLLSDCPPHSLRGGAVSNFTLLESSVSIMSDFFSFSILTGETMMVCTSRSFMFSISSSSFGNTLAPIITLPINSGSSAIKPRRR